MRLQRMIHKLSPDCGFRAFFNNIFEDPMLKTEIGEHRFKAPIILLKRLSFLTSDSSMPLYFGL